LVAEALGTAFLLAAIVGSGIMAERLSGGNVGLALLANTIASGAALAALILTFAPISGAHFKPAVTLSFAFIHRRWRELFGYTVAQVTGAIVGTMAANFMFGLALISLSRHDRSGGRLLFSEFVATFGLVHSDLLKAPTTTSCVCSRGLHHRWILVHRIHFVC
jgi:glycerol uptake facilitator-like aquaporin